MPGKLIIEFDELGFRIKAEGDKINEVALLDDVKLFLQLQKMGVVKPKEVIAKPTPEQAAKIKDLKVVN